MGWLWQTKTSARKEIIQSRSLNHIWETWPGLEGSSRFPQESETSRDGKQRRKNGQRPWARGNAGPYVHCKLARAERARRGREQGWRLGQVPAELSSKATGSHRGACPLSTSLASHIRSARHSVAQSPPHFSLHTLKSLTYIGCVLHAQGLQRVCETVELKDNKHFPYTLYIQFMHIIKTKISFFMRQLITEEIMLKDSFWQNADSAGS